jgi:antitoxin YefM
MPTITATEARKNLYKLVDSVSISHIPVQISGKNNSAVLISEDDWSSIQETLHLVAIPGMRDSIKNGMKAKIEDCSVSLKW